MLYTMFRTGSEYHEYKEIRFMTHNLGEKLKSLRKKYDLTQEQLAEKLGVSFQAVSKWETNAAAPDISMLPVLANFYRVTIDELLGVDIMRAGEKIEQYKLEIYRLLGEWKLVEAVDEARRACSEFPAGDDLRFLLAHTLEQAQNVMRTKDENLAEAIGILQKILETSTDTRLRLSCHAKLARLCQSGGNAEKALEYADQLPGLSSTSPCTILKIGLKQGADRISYVKNCISQFYSWIETGVQSVCGIWPYEYSDALTPEDKIALLDSMLALQSVVYGDELLAGNMNAVQYTYTKATLYCRIGNIDAALAELEKAVVYAEKFDTYNESATYTSPMQYGCKTLPRSHWSQSAFDDLHDEFYDSGKEKYTVLHGNVRFEAIAEQVRNSVSK